MECCNDGKQSYNPIIPYESKKFVTFSSSSRKKIVLRIIDNDPKRDRLADTDANVSWRRIASFGVIREKRSKWKKLTKERSAGHRFPKGRIF